MFFLFFHPMPAKTNWSSLFHQPYVSQYKYSYHIPCLPILFLSHRCRDEIMYDCLIRVHLMKVFSNHLTGFAWKKKKRSHKMWLLGQVNQAPGPHDPNAG